ncbi:hypothetical protein F4818DRAFT_456562 [Hypoxylon cercidicola]|nr:hypothetical protein F4818DRAFT_456562 [Hypoxylon cercidicola]
MPPGNRPKEVHTKHLTELERFRVRTLYFDAGMSKKRIEEVTGYSNSQIRTAVRAKSAAIPHRTGRPRKHKKPTKPPERFGQPSADGQQPAGPSQSLASAAEAEAEAEGDSALAAAAPPAAGQRRACFGGLPPDLRRYIWTLALLTSPLSVAWWVEPLPRAPWLVAGVFPAHWAAHWKAYAARRQAPARVLCAVSREARRVVLDTFAAVWSEAAVAATTATTTVAAGEVPFVWIDPRRDDIYCEDPAAAADLPALLDRSRAAVLPPHLNPSFPAFVPTLAAATAAAATTTTAAAAAAAVVEATPLIVTAPGGFIGNGDGTQG